jgi:demethylmenaquinone methyltransferase / 2-methoxy-6-polyprenyl-1,4-benzoquinol methylase
MSVTPYGTGSGKKQEVEQMFDQIAPRYDFLNHFLSAGIDIHWRKKAIKEIARYPHKKILDIATGTGDLAITASKLNPELITGVDLSAEMLAVGEKKIREKGLDKMITLVKGDSEKLPLADNTYDSAMVAFGVRNFENPVAGLTEICRVLKPGGFFIVLEFSKPEKFPVKQLYNFYFSAILPLIGKFISGDKRAYEYLPESVKAFPSGKDFLELMHKAGFEKTYLKKLSFGIASLYCGFKPN